MRRNAGGWNMATRGPSLQVATDCFADSPSTRRGASVISARTLVALLTLGLLAALYGALAVTDAGGRRLPGRLAAGDGVNQPAATLTGENELTGEGESEGTRFGYSVAVSADGNTALIGARANIGEVWVFTRSGETWKQQGPPLLLAEATAAHEGCEAGECGFGRSLALSADGNTALIGAPNYSQDRGAAWVFTRSGETWTQQGEALMGGEEEVGHARFGRSVALSADGSTALIGAGADDLHRGAAWVFTRAGETWTQQGAKLTMGSEEEGEGRFGRSVALSAVGDTALIGAPDDAGDRGAAWVFTRAGETWTQQGAKLTGAAEQSEGARFGTSVALSAFGNEALIGAPDDAEGAGAVFALARSGETWSQQGAKLTDAVAAGDGGGLGASVALSASGEVALIGAPREHTGVGAAYPFERSGAMWTAQEPLPGVDAPLRDHFATAVALSASGATALIGGPAAAMRAGAVWAFADGSAPAPTVTSVTPGSGPEAGGTPVTITGSGFRPGASVQIGGLAGEVDVLSETELTATTATHAPGPVEVVVSDGDGVSKGGPQFTFEAPPKGPQTPPNQQSNTTGDSSSSSPQGGSGNAGVGVLATVATGVPAPQFGVSGNLTPVSGRVYVKLPGAKGFVLLGGITQVPFGTIVNAIHGKVKVTTVAKNGHLQSITFYSGELELTQQHSGLVVATLFGGNFSVCPTKRERAHLASISSKHASGKHTVRKLWSEGHGSYSTKGNYASGAVLGTRWLTEDRCDGTLIRVFTDRVAVTNFVNHHHRTVRAGHSYLAKAL